MAHQRRFGAHGMRILVVAEPLGVLGAAEVTAAVRRGWLAHAASDHLEGVHLSDGASGLAEALSTAGWTARAAAADVVVLDGHTVVVDGGAALRGAGNTAPLARPLLEAWETGAGRVVVGLGPEPMLDGGAGLAEQLGGRFGTLGAARAAFAGRELLVAGADPLPLRGLHGAGPALSALVGAAAAQELANGALRFAAEVERALAPTDLTSGRPVRWSAQPRSGLGGGAAFLLLALGGSAVDSRALVAQSVGLGRAVAAADLCVAVAAELTALTLESSAVATAGESALEAGVPLVVLAGEDHTSRRQRAERGIVGCYEFGSGEGAEGIAVWAQRLARTWSR